MNFTKQSLEVAAKVDKILSDEGFRTLFTHVRPGILGDTAYTLWVHMGRPVDPKLVMIEPSGIFTSYDLKDDFELLPKAV